MKRITYILLMLPAFLLLACNSLEVEDPVTFSACAPLPVGRASAGVTVLDGKAYVLCGRTGATSGYLNDFWQYDPQTDTWTELATLPFKARVKPVVQTCGGKIYAGLGFNGRVYTDSCYLRDWWCYDPETERWTRKADYPVPETDGLVSFVADGNIYAGLGFYATFTSDIYEYDTETDKWLPYASGTIKGRLNGTGTLVGGRFFFGTGFRTYNLADWWEFVPETGKWHEKANLSGRGRVFAASTGIGDCVYLIGGRFFGGTETREEFYDDLLEYNIGNDTWRLRGNLPTGGRENAICFSIGGKGYIGLGANKNGTVLNDLYSWE